MAGNTVRPSWRRGSPKSPNHCWCRRARTMATGQLTEAYLGKSKNPNTRRWEAKGESGSMGGGNANANATATGITLQMQAPPIAIAPEALLHKMTQMQCERTNPKIPSTRPNPKIQTQIQSTNPKSKDRKQEGREKAVQRCTKQWYLWCWSLAPMGQPEQVHGIVIFESTNAA